MEIIVWDLFFVGIFGVLALGGWALLRARGRTHRSGE